MTLWWCSVVDKWCFMLQKVEEKPQVVVKPIQTTVKRPSADEPLTCLPMTVSESLKQALANRLQQLSVTDNKADGTVLLTLTVICNMFLQFCVVLHHRRGVWRSPNQHYHLFSAVFLGAVFSKTWPTGESTIQHQKSNIWQHASCHCNAIVIMSYVKPCCFRVVCFSVLGFLIGETWHLPRLPRVVACLSEQPCLC